MVSTKHVKWLWALALLFLLTGCARSTQDPPASSRVVVQVSVTTDSHDPDAHREYTSSEKMGAVLTYLRLLRPSSKASVNPQHVAGEMYYFVITNSDGTHVVYQQKADRYFRNEDKTWVVIDESFGSKLPQLLSSLPSD